MFDIDVKGGIRFKESDALSPGNNLAILNLDGFKIGIGICYDIRFDELARIYRNNGNHLTTFGIKFKTDFVFNIFLFLFQFKVVTCFYTQLPLI